MRPGRHLDQRLRVGEPFEIFIVKLVLAGRENSGDAFAIAGRLGDEFELLRSGLLEQYGLVGLFDDGAQCRQRQRLVVNIDLAERDEAIDEIAQAVFGPPDGEVGRQPVGHFTVCLSRRQRFIFQQRRPARPVPRLNVAQSQRRHGDPQ